jgi:phosphotransferase family enzyme
MVPSWVAARVDADEWEPITGGYTKTPKWRARRRDGTTVFVKAGQLRSLEAELVVYREVCAPFVPVVHDLWDDAERVVLVLEDLSRAEWPPPYPEDVGPLFTALNAAAALPAPELPPLSDRELSSWGQIAKDPEPLLALGVCTERWLTRALPLLASAEAAVPATGKQLVHNDIWTDNLCFTDRGVVLVDWAQARMGNARIDVAFALLSLQVAGARVPELEDAAALAAFVTGIVATESIKPPPSWSHSGAALREDQLADLRIALPWTAGLLGLPPPF